MGGELRGVRFAAIVAAFLVALAGWLHLQVDANPTAHVPAAAVGAAEEAVTAAGPVMGEVDHAGGHAGGHVLLTCLVALLFIIAMAGVAPARWTRATATDPRGWPLRLPTRAPAMKAMVVLRV